MHSLRRLGRAHVESGTFPVRWSDFGRMPFLTPVSTHSGTGTQVRWVEVQLMNHGCCLVLLVCFSMKHSRCVRYRWGD